MFPVIFVEVHISVSFPPPINPKYLVFWFDLLRVHAFFSQWHFVLLVVVDRGHFFDEADEDRHGVFGKMCARMSTLSQKCKQVGQ